MRPFKDFTLSKKYPALHESLPERHPCKHHIPLSAKVCNEWKFWHKSSIFVFFFSTDYYLIFVEPDLCSAHPALCDDLSTLVCGINWSTSEGPFEPVPCWHCASCMDTGCRRTTISPALRKSPKGWNPFTKKFLTFYCKVYLYCSLLSSSEVLLLDFAIVLVKTIKLWVLYQSVSILLVSHEMQSWPHALWSGDRPAFFRLFYLAGESYSRVTVCKYFNLLCLSYDTEDRIQGATR